MLPTGEGSKGVLAPIRGMRHGIVKFRSWLFARCGRRTPSSMSHRFAGHPLGVLTGRHLGSSRRQTPSEPVTGQMLSASPPRGGVRQRAHLEADEHRPSTVLRSAERATSTTNHRHHEHHDLAGPSRALGPTTSPSHEPRSTTTGPPPPQDQRGLGLRLPTSLRPALPTALRQRAAPVAADTP